MASPSTSFSFASPPPLLKPPSSSSFSSSSALLRTSRAALPPSREAWDAKLVEETRLKITQKYGNDFSHFLKDDSPAPPPKPRRHNKGTHHRGKPAQLKMLDNQATNTTHQHNRPPRTTHKLLQVLGGKVKRKKLLSPAGMDVRPMMQIVRGAVFGILQAAGGRPASLRPGRWLDLYSGTGSVGIEAISRGCSEAHFVEMDPWVISEVLQPNLTATGFIDVSVIHMKRVEIFLENAEKSPDKDNKFDYISVTPPYLEVDYAKLMDQISRSPLLGEDCFVVVEYPLKTTMPDACSHLIKIVDRRFGRTNLLIYGPQWAEKKKKNV